MALTETQIDTVFEILELPRSSDVDMPTGTMGISGQTFYESNDDFKLQSKVETRLAALTSAQQTRIGTYIERWEAIGTRVASISGGVGGIQGVEYDPDTELMRIQERVKRLCNVYKYLDEIRMEKKRGGVIPVFNG